jgi:DNA-binding CsgD family transcriptional regulator
MLKECADFYRESGNKAYLALSLENLSRVYRRIGRMEECTQLLLDFYRLNLEMNYPRGVSRALAFPSRDAIAAGHWTEAQQWLAKARDHQQQHRDPLSLMETMFGSGKVAVYQGDLSQAQQFFQVALDARLSPDGIGVYDLETTVESGLYLGLIADAKGASDDALQLVDEAMSAAAQHDFLRAETEWGRLTRGLVLCSLKRFDAALQEFAAFVSKLADYQQLGYVNRYWRAEHLLVVPVAVFIQANRGEAVRAAELLGLIFSDPRGPRGYLEQHQAIAQLRDDLEDALGTEAYSTAWKRGATRDIEQVVGDLQRELTAASEDSIAQANQALVEPLTERELEVLRLMAEGLDSPEAAERLHLAVSTVRWHLRQVYSKLDVHSRTQAIARARELHLLP